MEELEEKFKSLEESLAKEEAARKELESLNSKLASEKQALALQIERERESTTESDERSAKILSQKADVERQVSPIHIFFKIIF